MYFLRLFQHMTSNLDFMGFGARNLHRIYKNKNMNNFNQATNKTNKVHVYIEIAISIVIL